MSDEGREDLMSEWAKTSPVPTSGVDSILHERGLTNGPYDKMCATAQGIKAAMRTGTNWNMLSHAQREALELIAHKAARILEGDPTFHDHWDDIGGYAKLGRDNPPNWHTVGKWNIVRGKSGTEPGSQGQGGST